MVVSREPMGHLRPYVRRYDGFREETRALTRRREGPGAEIVVLFSFDTEWRIGDAVDPDGEPERHSSFAAGLRLTSVLTEHDGLAHGLQVSLTPPGAHALLGVPMHELAGCTVPLDALLGAQAGELVERLAGERGWTERFALLDSVLASRVGAVLEPTPGVMWAWRRLVETDGRVAIRTLVEELGWSPKRLLARFREEVGLSPKALARLLRFERAAAALECPDRPGLAEVALDCGYYDQSHLTNEFRRITGVTPATFFQDAVAPPS